MSTLPRWSVLAFFILLLGGVILVTQRFAEAPPLLIEGDLILATGLEEHVKESRQIFIVFHADEPESSQNAETGESPPRRPPLGVLALSLQIPAKTGDFLHFQATPQNVQIMAGGNIDQWPKTLRIKARLDTTGQGGQDKPGDITGEIKNVELGTKGLQIVMDHLVPAAP